jgi:tryptophanyl-tRNA synthetase
MSKTDPSEMSRIHLTDSDDDIAQKIRKAKTDPEPLPEREEDLKERPEAANLVGIYAAVTGESVDQVLARFAGQGFGNFKPALADALVALLAPLRGRFEELRRDSAELDRILAAGADRAIALGAPILAESYRAVAPTRALHSNVSLAASRPARSPDAPAHNPRPSLRDRSSPEHGSPSAGSGSRAW